MLVLSHTQFCHKHKDLIRVILLKSISCQDDYDYKDV